MAPKGKQANISKVPPLISSYPSKKILEKSKFFMKNLVSSLTRNPLKKPSYFQASKGNVNEIIRINETFPELPANKVSEIYKILNNINQNKKSKLNMIMKDLSRKQVIVPISTNNTTNKVAISSDLNIIKKYLKDSNNIEYKEGMSPKLLQSKSYLKIHSILHFVESINLLISFDIVKSVIKSTCIFNNIILAFCPHIIKTSPKLNIAISGTNMNLEVL